MALKTRLTELLGIEHPIVQGGMMWVGRAELAAAVSNAGGLGILTALTQPTPDDLRREIDRCRAMTDKPFGVNLTILPSVSPPPYAEYRRAIVDSGVKIVETAGYKPAEHVDHFKAHGITVLHKCTAVRHAVSAERLGVDVISIDGFECAGHPGEGDIPGLILIPAAVDRLKIPVIASGGFGDGRGLVAALALGAAEIEMGTRFVATRECVAHAAYKEALIRASERDTVVIERSVGRPGRVLDTPGAQKILAAEAGATSIEELLPLIEGRVNRLGAREGDLEEGFVWAGQVAGLIDDAPPVADLIARMVAGAAEIVGHVGAQFAVPS
jgi:nitronate monooxygenase